jgi:hypothetical protein
MWLKPAIHGDIKTPWKFKTLKQDRFIEKEITKQRNIYSIECKTQSSLTKGGCYCYYLIQTLSLIFPHFPLVLLYGRKNRSLMLPSIFQDKMFKFDNIQLLDRTIISVTIGWTIDNRFPDRVWLASVFTFCGWHCGYVYTRLPCGLP